MKTFAIRLAVFCLLSFSLSRAQAIQATSRNNSVEPTTVKFKLITTQITPPLRSGDFVGIRGGIAPLVWNRSKFMTDANGDGIYEVSLTFNTAICGILEYKFVIERNDGTIQWEGIVGFGTSSSGNRVLALCGCPIELPPVHFDRAVPLAKTDVASTPQDAAVTIAVLENDSHPIATAKLTVTNVTQPVNGSASIKTGGSTINYAPTPGFSGIDFFTYQVTDNFNHSDTGFVSVAVLPSIDPAQVLVYNNDFRGNIGPEWSKRSTDVTPSGTKRFLGQFSNENVRLSLSNLPKHIEATISFDLFIIRSWDGIAACFGGPDIWDLHIVNGPILLHTTFSMGGDSIQSYPDDYPVGRNHGLKGASERNTLGFDFNGFVLDAVYKLTFTFPHTSSSLVFDFSAANLQQIFDESWGIGNVEIRLTPENVSCTYTISPSNNSFPATGGAGSVAVATTNGCSWSATSNTSWVTITSGGSGNGNGTVAYTVDANTSQVSRTGTLTIAGKTHTVTQEGVSSTRRNVRLKEVFAAQGGKVSVPVILEAQGDENALGFSLQFDPNVLQNPTAVKGTDVSAATLNTNSSQAGSGRYGIALALPTGQAFSTGSREIAVVTFDIRANISIDSTEIEFVDQPIVREVVDINANTLNTAWIGGKIKITHGYETDVAPRQNGNNDGRITIADWTQVGRFVAGLDEAAIFPNEFQRADCAPKNSFGDGRLTIADWVQAGRDAAGLDVVRKAGGPISPQTTLQFIAKARRAFDFLHIDSDRSVRIAGQRLIIGQSDTIQVTLDAQGDENAIGFSLNFDPQVITFERAELGSNATNATLNINATQKDSGRIGIALALPTGQAFAAGSHEIVLFIFVAPNGPAGKTTTLSFGDVPIFREVVDTLANTLSTSFADSITVTLDIDTAVQDEIPARVPTEYDLVQNSPNPFNPSTVIRYQIPIAGTVELTIYNTLGQKVRTLVNAFIPAGVHSIRWNGRNDFGERVPSGVYLYRLHAAEFVQHRKMLLVQ